MRNWSKLRLLLSPAAIATTFIPWFRELKSVYPGAPISVRYILGRQTSSGMLVLSVLFLLMIICLFKTKLLQERLVCVRKRLLWTCVLVCCADASFLSLKSEGGIYRPDIGFYVCLLILIISLYFNGSCETK